MKPHSLFFIPLLLGAAMIWDCPESCGDATETLRSNLPKEIMGWSKAEEDRLFDQRTIFDYIDGAGEVYRAYGMRSCLTRRYTRERGPAIILDVFDMGSSEDAYGVFTHDQDGKPLDIGQGALLRPGWLSFWKGRFYVSLYGEEDTPAVEEALLALGKSTATLIIEEGRKPEILRYLPQAGLRPRSIRYLHDHLILNYHYYVSEDNILLMDPRTDAALAGYQWERDVALLLLVSYPDEKRATDAFQGLRRHYLPDADAKGFALLENKKWSGAGRKGRFLAAILETDSRERGQDLLGMVLDLLPPPKQ